KSPAPSIHYSEINIGETSMLKRPFMIVILLYAGAAGAFDAVGWRNDGSGHYPDGASPTEWNRTFHDGKYTCKNIRWMTRIAPGAVSAPIVVGERLYLTAGTLTATSTPLDLICVDAASGKIRWIRSLTFYDAASDEDRNSVKDRGEPLVAELQKVNDEL